MLNHPQVAREQNRITFVVSKGPQRNVLVLDEDRSEYSATLDRYGQSVADRIDDHGNESADDTKPDNQVSESVLGYWAGDEESEGFSSCRADGDPRQSVSGWDDDENDDGTESEERSE